MKKNWLKAIIGCVLSLTMALCLGGCFGKIKDVFPRPNTSETSSAPNTSISVGGTSTSSPDDTGTETDDGNPLCEEYGHLYEALLCQPICGETAKKISFCTRPECDASYISNFSTIYSHTRDENGICTLCGDGAEGCDGNHNFSHDYLYKLLVHTTCTTDGVYLVKCLYCNTFQQKTFSAFGHSYTDGVCVRCGQNE